ncbi:MOSC domain-containing protein [Phreatobacter aquaticus]|uniref:MOSC domain-containing protein n=1 Tax=Phreatobacter aquaticus TaxID=2570229 RepID=A0A4D7QDL3_9HYPH|nr:MOSC N-terminal beta barrel domain-containing protein [Phreatobacter aquaticus]QCK84745.1 MOSC domain-containing protein [Phreatobacter aquaticus]
MTEQSPRIAALYRYPVKGLSAEPLTEALLEKSRHFPGDRLFAIENGPSGFDAAAPEHQAKTKFLVLARQAALAKLRTRYDDVTGELSIVADEIEAARGDLSTAEGRSAIEAFFRMFLAKDLAGEPKVLVAPPAFRFMDSRSGFVSIINLATVRALEKETGMAIDPIRFRANVYIDGITAFSEFEWVGQEINLGGTRLKGLKRTERCAATTVNPATAVRDLMIPAFLMRTYGHADCGIYCEVTESGRIAVQDRLSVTGPAPSQS